MPGHRRRVRVREDHDRAVDHAAAAPGRAHHRRDDHPGRAGDLLAGRGRDAPRPRQRGRDDLPGPDDLAEPDDDGRRPDRRDRAAAPRRGRQDRAGPRGRGAGPGRHAPARRAGVQLPAPAVGRHAAAGHDRDGAGLRAQAADRRRADHGAGRDDPEADPRAHRRPAPAAGHGGHPGHPRPGGDRRARRPGRGDVRGQGDGVDHHGPAVRQPPASLHRGAVRRAAGEGRRPDRAAVQHPRAAPGPDRPAGRVPVRRPVPVRAGHAAGRPSRRWRGTAGITCSAASSRSARPRRTPTRRSCR